MPEKKDKKSFVLYFDLIHSLEKLTDEECGKLFKTILRYVNNQETKIKNNRLLEIAFEPIKQTLDRDNIKYKEFIERQKANGSKGGKPKKPKPTQAYPSLPKPNGGKPKNPSLPTANLSDSVSDSDINKKEINKEKEILFRESELFNKVIFKQTFPEWSKEKLAYYYNQLLNWSDQGKKKKDWKATAENWERKDRAEGKLKFNIPTQMQSYIL